MSESTTISYVIKYGVFFGAGFHGTFNCFIWEIKYLKDARRVKKALEKYGIKYVCKQFPEYEQQVGMPGDLKVEEPMIFKRKITERYREECDTFVNETVMN